MGRATPIQYHQAEVSAGDLFLISPNPPVAWNQALLQSLYGKPLEQVHLQLLQHAGEDVEAALVDIRTGDGQLLTLRPELKTGEDEISAPPVVPPEAPTETSLQTPTTQSEISTGSPPPTDAASPQLDAPKSKPAVQQPSVVIAPTKDATPESQDGDPNPQPLKRKRKPFIGPALLTFSRAVGTTLRQFFLTLGTMVRRMLPDEKILDLPPSVMLFGAVAIPLIVVAIAGVVYAREGRGRMYQEQLVQAQSIAEQALPLQDPLEVRNAWDQVLFYLDEAAQYGDTQEARDLRAYAYSVLDNLDIVERLDYQAGIVNGLPRDVTVAKIVVNADNELYLLNGENGYVLRATYTDQGYELDPVFNCGPVPGPLQVGALIDIEALPRGQEDGATLLGMDANGNLLRCIPGEENAPSAMQMAPPDVNWGEPRTFALDGGNIYVLDPQTNSVWIYWAIDGYAELPTYFFGNQVPPLHSVLDMTVSDGNLYLLHEDGHMTVCDYNSYIDAPTRCTDPAEYIDLRAGYPSGPQMQGTQFSQLQFAPPPDPSIYLFDPQDEAIYHLSMRLAYQRQYRPAEPLLAEEVTAFAVGRDRRAFIATENQVYFAVMP
jgi:hypothetical protein